MRNKEIFQGEKYLNNAKDYFEGWYFKNNINDYVISFIPGIIINDKEKKAFIQVITNDNSYFIGYDIKSFKYSNDPFYIEIDGNHFSKEKIYLDINHKDLKISGYLKYSNSINIKTGIISPNIMGPFSYLPMECNHVILSMKNRIDGIIMINDKKIKFDNGTGYIEKDYGTSFPTSYIWMQGNSFDNENAAFMLSIADIPFLLTDFRGLICVLMINDKEYKFTTYNGCRILKYDITDKINIILKKGKFILDVSSSYDSAKKLAAPIKGKMNKDIYESLTSNIEITLKEKDKILVKCRSKCCGVEVVK